MRTLRLASAVAATALLVGGLTACSSSGSGAGKDAAAPAGGTSPATAAAGSGGSSASAGSSAAAGAVKPDPNQDPKAALLASAAVMEKAKGAKLTRTTGDGGSGSYVWQPGSAALDLALKDKGTESRMLAVDSALYTGLDAETAALMNGKKWLKLDPKSAGGDGRAGGAEDYGSIAGMLVALNPGAQLAANAGAGRLSRVGEEKIDGVDTVHYRSEAPIDEVAKLLPIGKDQFDLVSGLLKKDGDTSTVDFWINGKGELVQQTNTNTGAGLGGPQTFKYTEIGSTPAVKAPADSEVMDFADMLKSPGN
ncbi:hypothetical protein [Saccharothrix sp. ST-888]|uniref:hypothetical protein n=1 Tax=Saccharothrix sp. ST-888 TaxID=1427391 RepID=UPI0005EC845F|nr:hypothetical protein [Saccharothrix sp. ST-888]KJK56894.1 hypothetical protein UK12_19600 [Saccharothrix sp. ST-888]